MTVAISDSLRSRPKRRHNSRAQYQRESNYSWGKQCLDLAHCTDIQSHEGKCDCTLQFHADPPTTYRYPRESLLTNTFFSLVNKSHTFHFNSSSIFKINLQRSSKTKIFHSKWTPRTLRAFRTRLAPWVPRPWVFPPTASSCKTNVDHRRPDWMERAFDT